MRQRIEEYTGEVGYINTILILSFGSAMVGFGVLLIKGQRRMEHRQQVFIAAWRAQAGAPEPEPEPEKRHLRLVPPGAALLTLAVVLRRHWVRTVSAAGGALAATAVVLGLMLGNQPPATAGPPQAGQPTTASLTGATSPATTASAVPSSSRPVPVGGTQLPPVVVAEPVVYAGGAPSLPPPPTVAPSTQPPVPSRSPSAPGTTPAPTGKPTPGPPPSSSTPCLLAVNAQPILGVCLL